MSPYDVYAYICIYVYIGIYILMHVYRRRTEAAFNQHVRFTRAFRAKKQGVSKAGSL